MSAHAIPEVGTHAKTHSHPNILPDSWRRAMPQELACGAHLHPVEGLGLRNLFQNWRHALMRLPVMGQIALTGIVMTARVATTIKLFGTRHCQDTIPEAI